MNMSQQSQRAALVSWSGGKDSFLALWRARQSGLPVRRLVTALEEDGTASRSHGLPPALLAAQASALGLEAQFFCAGWKTYEERFTALLRQSSEQGITDAVFGDIDLVPHREWEEKVCARAGLQLALPLWNEPRDKLVQEVLALGVKAIVVCVNGNFLPSEFCGREYDAAFIADLPASADACGENGEFHTFVYDGPGFAHPVPFQRKRISSVQGPAEFGPATYYFQQLAPAS